MLERNFRKALRAGTDPGFLGAALNTLLFVNVGGPALAIMLAATAFCAVSALTRNMAGNVLSNPYVDRLKSRVSGKFQNRPRVEKTLLHSLETARHARRIALHKNFTYGVMALALGGVMLAAFVQGAVLQGFAAMALASAYIALMGGYRFIREKFKNSTSRPVRFLSSLASDSTAHLAVGRIMGAVLAGGILGLSVVPFVAISARITLENNMRGVPENTGHPKLWLAASGLVAGCIGLALSGGNPASLYFWPAIANLLSIGLFAAMEHRQTGRLPFIGDGGHMRTAAAAEPQEKPRETAFRPPLQSRTAPASPLPHAPQP